MDRESACEWRNSIGIVRFGIFGPSGAGCPGSRFRSPRDGLETLLRCCAPGQKRAVLDILLHSRLLGACVRVKQQPRRRLFATADWEDTSSVDSKPGLSARWCSGNHISSMGDKRNGPSAMAAGIYEPELAGDSISEGGALFSFLEVVGGVVFVLGFRNPS
ncbi:hypothetical protein K438DRAFT_1781569 [Mycena galopus ATCC 62051]|nr:hypothetical protein K438DRAFT_1781569 [Mycena galopus ATCC 62051]